MKEWDKIKNNIGFFIEQHFPKSLFIVTFIICLTTKKHFNLNEYMDNLIGATITFSSIIVGFVGVLLAVLFSLRQSDTVKELFKYRVKERLKRYFERNIFSGVSVVGISALMYLRNILNFEIILGITVSKLLGSLWIGLIVYLLTATFILLNIIMHIIFSDDEIEEVDTLTNEELTNLQEQCSKKMKGNK